MVNLSVYETARQNLKANKDKIQYMVEQGIISEEDVRLLKEEGILDSGC